MNLPSAIRNGFLTVKASPNAKKTRITKIEDGVVHLAVKAPPEEGKANAEIERFLRKELGHPVRITAGKTRKTKRARVEK